MIESNAASIAPSESEWTEITIERPTKEGVQKISLKVPFTATEVDEIQKARLEMELLRSEAMRGSSWIRDLYVDHRVPWGGTLLNRQKAIDSIQGTAKFIEKLSELKIQPADLDSLEHAKAVQQHLTVFSQVK